MTPPDCIHLYEGLEPPSGVQLALSTYHKYKDTDLVVLKDNGLLQCFTTCKIFAGLWNTVGPNLMFNRETGSVELYGKPCERRLIHSHLLESGWDIDEQGRLPEYKVLEQYAKNFSYINKTRIITSL